MVKARLSYERLANNIGGTWEVAKGVAGDNVDEDTEDVVEGCRMHLTSVEIIMVGSNRWRLW